MKPMIIEVTSKDIRKGVKEESKSCPVALALNRETGFNDFRVNPASITRGFPFSTRYYHVPRSVKRFVHWFDDGKKVQPFRFILRGAS